jgi:hypothetical protein
MGNAKKICWYIGGDWICKTPAVELPPAADIYTIDWDYVAVYCAKDSSGNNTSAQLQYVSGVSLKKNGTAVPDSPYSILTNFTGSGGAKTATEYQALSTTNQTSRANALKTYVNGLIPSGQSIVDNTSGVNPNKTNATACAYTAPQLPAIPVTPGVYFTSTENWTSLMIQLGSSKFSEGSGATSQPPGNPANAVRIPNESGDYSAEPPASYTTGTFSINYVSNFANQTKYNMDIYVGNDTVPYQTYEYDTPVGNPTTNIIFTLPYALVTGNRIIFVFYKQSPQHAIDINRFIMPGSGISDVGIEATIFFKNNTNKIMAANDASPKIFQIASNANYNIAGFTITVKFKSSVNRVHDVRYTVQGMSGAPGETKTVNHSTGEMTVTFDAYKTSYDIAWATLFIINLQVYIDP